MISGNTVNIGNIELHNCSGALKVLRNRVSHYRYDAIQVVDCEGTASERGLIANNFIKQGTSQTFRGLSVSFESSYQDVFYNTIIVESSGGSNYAFQVSSAGAGGNNVRIMNNNLVTLDETLPYKIESPEMITASDYNNIYNAGNVLVTIGYVNPLGCHNLDSLRIETGKDLHSISVYPMFADVNEPYTYHPWLNGAGTPLTGLTDDPEVTVDIDGNPRDPNNPDIGCCEFTANPNSTPYSGAVLIGGGGNFPSFSQAVDSLMWRGISGPVTLNVLAGQYNEQLFIRDIPGTSREDTIVFQSQTGTPEDVNIRYNATSEAGNYLVNLYSADHFTFRNMTFTAEGTNYARVFYLSGYTPDIKIENNILNGTSSGGYLFYSNYSKSDLLLIKENKFNSGGGIDFIGDVNNISDSVKIVNNILVGNIVLSALNAPVVTQNIVNRGRIQLIGCSGALKVLRNRVAHYQYDGIEINDCQGTTSERGLIANNFVRQGTTRGIYGLSVSHDSHYQDVFYNTVIVKSSGSGHAFTASSGGIGGRDTAYGIYRRS